MDIISHAIMGKIMAARKHSRKVMWTAMIFSVMPDFTQFILYPVVGFHAHRFLWIPQLTDWVGFRAIHPYWSMLWEIPHSVFFLILVIVPIVILFRIPRIAILAYAVHIVVDLFSHTGEWGVKLFYPFGRSFPGLTDGWAWPWWAMLVAWVVLLLIAAALSKYAPKKLIQ